MRGFTSISEALEPEELREYINEYLTDMSGIIRSKHRGTLDKYIGDAIMAFWGAPVDDAQHARQRRARGARDAEASAKALNAKFAARGWPTIKIGVGVNTGTVRVGDMGSQVRARLHGDGRCGESRLAPGGPHQVIRRRHPGRRGDPERGQGRRVPRDRPRAGQGQGRGGQRSTSRSGWRARWTSKTQDELKLWHQALRLYRAQQWDQAELRLLNLQRMNPECALYDDVCGAGHASARTPPAGGLGRRDCVRREVGERVDEAAGSRLQRRHRRAASAHHLDAARSATC